MRRRSEVEKTNRPSPQHNATGGDAAREKALLRDILVRRLPTQGGTSVSPPYKAEVGNNGVGGWARKPHSGLHDRRYPGGPPILQVTSWGAPSATLSISF